jgi:hypothetical protein
MCQDERIASCMWGWPATSMCFGSIWGLGSQAAEEQHHHWRGRLLAISATNKNKNMKCSAMSLNLPPSLNPIYAWLVNPQPAFCHEGQKTLQTIVLQNAHVRISAVISKDLLAVSHASQSFNRLISLLGHEEWNSGSGGTIHPGLYQTSHDWHCEPSSYIMNRISYPPTPVLSSISSLKWSVGYAHIQSLFISWCIFKSFMIGCI